jgi:glycogen(starch) synthase
MRILVISNLYPPLHQGGYEIGCKDIADRLTARGHEVKVLTSMHRCTGPVVTDNIHRRLQLSFDRIPSPEFTLEKERINQSAFLRLCNDFDPEVVFMWNLAHVSISAAELACRRGIPTAYYISDNWLATWEMDHWYQLHRSTQVNAHGLTPPPTGLELTNTIFASQYLRSRVERVGKKVAGSTVIRWGVDTQLFQSRPKLSTLPARLLFVGQILPHKGVHTAIDALATLTRTAPVLDYSLTIVGDCDASPGYVSQLRAQASSLGLSGRVVFTGKLPRHRLPDVYAEHDILIFPSVWDEPFAITPLEAMATKIAVVATPTGGSSEIFEHGKNAMVFEAEDSVSCASHIHKLALDQTLYESICRTARTCVEKQFTIERMVDGIETVLSRAVGAKGTSPEHRPGSLQPPQPNVRHIGSSPSITRRLTRALAGRAVAAVSYVVGRLRSSTEVHKARTVLVVLLGEVPEIVFAGPSVRAVREIWPDAQITLVVQPQFRALVDACPYIDAVHEFEWKTVSEQHRPTVGSVTAWMKNSRRSWRDKERGAPDVAISLSSGEGSGYVASGIFMAMTGARHRIGFRYAPNALSVRHKILDLFSCDGPARGVGGHEGQRQVELLRFLGASQGAGKLELWSTPDDEIYVDDLLSTSQLYDKYFLVALAPGGASPAGSWPVSHFVETAEWLIREHSASIVIADAGGAQKVADSIETTLGGRVLNLAGKVNLRQLGVLLRKCQLVIGGDSEAIHLSSAAGVPLIALFGSGEYQRFRPVSKNQTALHMGLLCSPCFEHCMFDRPNCIEAIGVDQVKAAVATVLKTRSQYRLQVQ